MAREIVLNNGVRLSHEEAREAALKAAEKIADIKRSKRNRELLKEAREVNVAGDLLAMKLRTLKL